MVGDILLIIVLYLAAMLLIVLEICTPTFGVVSVLAMGCLVAAIYFCYQLSPVVGIVATVATVLVFPAFVIVAVKKIPHTALGRRLVLSRQQSAPGEGTPQADRLQRLVGMSGVADTLLRPSGAVRVDGERIIASAESSTIEKGSRIKVVRVDGTNVIVRKIDGGEGVSGQ